MYCKLRRLELLRNGLMSDCDLHVWYLERCKKRCCRQFRCHKIILASASEEFQRLINEPDFEKNKRVINVDDATPDAYEALLLYVYTYEIYNSITMDMCGDLIHLASKYKMPDFIDSYISKLASQNWSMDTVLNIFQLADEHNRPTVMNLVGNKIVPIATQVLNDNSFLRLNVKQLKSLMIILKSAETIPDKQLLQALKKYQKCNNLRFENMPCFQQFVEVTNLFGDVHFEADGTLSLDDKKRGSKQPIEVATPKPSEAENETTDVESENPKPSSSPSRRKS